MLEKALDFLDSYMVNILASILLIVLFFVAIKLIKRATKSISEKNPHQKHYFIALKKILNLICIVFLLSFLVISWGGDLGAVVVLLGSVLGLVAIGFIAVWSILSNVSSFFIMIFHNTLRVGTKIKLIQQGIEGEITEIDFMYTTIKDNEQNEIKIPNNFMFQNCIKIYS